MTCFIEKMIDFLYIAAYVVSCSTCAKILNGIYLLCSAAWTDPTATLVVSVIAGEADLVRLRSPRGVLPLLWTLTLGDLRYKKYRLISNTSMYNMLHTNYNSNQALSYKIRKLPCTIFFIWHDISWLKDNKELSWDKWNKFTRLKGLHCK